MGRLICGDMPMFVGGTDNATERAHPIIEVMVTAKLAGLDPEICWEVMKGGAEIDPRVAGNWLAPWEVKKD